MQKNTSALSHRLTYVSLALLYSGITHAADAQTSGAGGAPRDFRTLRDADAIFDAPRDEKDGRALVDRNGGEERASYMVRNIRPLRFGSLVSSDRSVGELTIDPKSGARRAGGGATDLGGSFEPALFEIRGREGDRFVVDLPARVEADGNAGEIRDFAMWPTDEITLGRGGRATFAVGGTLRVAPAYSGSVDGDFAINVERALE
ncbi:MAG: DUF4402 domain-containing protein [Rickettsiales bacterium]